MTEDPEDRPPDPDVYIRAQLRQTEEQMEALVANIAASREMGALKEVLGWQRLVKISEKMEERRVEVLCGAYLTPYELGRQQGFIQGLKVLMRPKQLSPEELAETEAAITLLRNQIRDYRDQLA